MTTKIYKTYRGFLKRKNRKDNGVSPKFAKDYPEYYRMNTSNEGCWECVYCDNCENCDYCSFCASCWDCNKCNDCMNCSLLVGARDEMCKVPTLVSTGSY